MINGNVPPLRLSRPFPLIAGLMVNWYKTSGPVVASGRPADALLRVPTERKPGLERIPGAFTQIIIVQTSADVRVDITVNP